MGRGARVGRSGGGRFPPTRHSGLLCTPPIGQDGPGPGQNRSPNSSTAPLQMICKQGQPLPPLLRLRGRAVAALSGAGGAAAPGWSRGRRGRPRRVTMSPPPVGLGRHRGSITRTRPRCCTRSRRRIHYKAVPAHAAKCSNLDDGSYRSSKILCINAATRHLRQ